MVKREPGSGPESRGDAMTQTQFQRVRQNANVAVMVGRAPWEVSSSDPTVGFKLERLLVDSVPGILPDDLHPETSKSDAEGLEEIAATPMRDAVSQYLFEICQVPLLTLAEEIDLGRRIEEGRQAMVTLKASPSKLTERGKRDLERLVSDADLARQQLIEANLRLVVSHAKRYAWHSLDLLDLIQEGNRGLMRAVDRFEVSRGFKFSTYASWWIRQSIQRALADQGRMIRLPVHVNETMTKLSKIRMRLEQELGRAPTSAELAEATGVNWTEARIEMMRRYDHEPASLENLLWDDGETRLSDTIPSDEGDSPIEHATTQYLNEELERALDSLEPREALVVSLRNGLADGHAYTLEDIGKELHLTRERVRQIESSALRQLRYQKRLQHLRAFLE
jgi:RNA polymerase primary sigma factor